MRFIYLIIVIFLLSLNLRPSITSVGPLLDIIKTDLGMSRITASLITTLPVFCMGLFSLLSIKLSNRLGIEKSLLFAMILIFAATLLRVFFHSSAFLIVTAFVAGVGIGISGPLISGFVKKHFPDKLGVTSVYSVAMVIGAAVAITFSIPLFHAFNDSWQLSLSFWSILALAAALFLIPLLKGKPDHQAFALPSLRIANKRVYASILFFGCMAAIFYSVTAWLAPFAQSKGMSYAESGLLLTLFTLIQIPISFLFPMLASKTVSRKLLLLSCCVSEMIGILLLLTYISPWAAAIFLGIGAGGLFPLALLIPIADSKNTEEATSWSAQMQSGGFMLGSIGPLVFGLTLDMFGSFTPALVVVLVTILVMSAAIAGMEKRSFLVN